jgi:hypothetical protein
MNDTAHVVPATGSADRPDSASMLGAAVPADPAGPADRGLVGEGPGSAIEGRTPFQLAWQRLRRD